MITIERETLSEAWVDALAAVLDAGGKAVNVITSWSGEQEVRSVRNLLDDFVTSRPKRKSGSGWPIETVANTIFAADLYDEALGTDALDDFIEMYLEGREVARIASPDGEYCERLVAWEGQPGEPVNQLAVVAGKLRKYADPDSRYRYSSDYELAIEHPSFDLRTQMPGKNGSPYAFPCLSHISLTVDNGVVHLTALYRNQHLISKAYGNYLGLARLGNALCHHSGLELGTITVVATHADSELGTAAGLGKAELRNLIAQARTALATTTIPRSGAALRIENATRQTAMDIVGGEAMSVGVDAVCVADFALDICDETSTLSAVFVDEELAECDGDHDRLAARFAAKEATLKALGTGIRGLDMLDIIVCSATNGEPSLELSERAQNVAVDRGLSDFRCSFTHEEGFAIAVVVASRALAASKVKEAS